MKKIISLIMMMLLSISLAACTQPDVSNPGTTPNTEEKPNTDGQTEQKPSTPETKPDSNTDKPTTPDTGTKPEEKPGTPLVPIQPSEPVEQPDTNVYEVRKDYYYEFKSGDISSSGSQVLCNNLTWNYTQPTYLGFDALKGVQIGSGNRPESNFVLDTQFGERVKVTSFSLELGKGSRGSSTYTVELGKFSKNDTISNNDATAYTVLDVNQATNNFKITLSSSAKAMYIKSISISLLTTKDSKLDFAAPTPQPETPVGPVIPGQGDIPVTNYTLSPNIVEEYYKLFDLTLTGEALRKELDVKNDLKTQVSYGDARNMLCYTDEIIDKPGYVYSLYDGEAYKAKWTNGLPWNREHVWACNHMTHTGNRDLNNDTKDHKSDLHNLRVCTQSVNSSRGDKYFSQLINDTDHYDPNTVAPAGVDFRGDVARILFYMYSQYDFLYLNDEPSANLDYSMGQLTELLEWHALDPVDAFEIQRNNRVYQYQGNRNPFIDKPELAKQLFQ